MTPIAPGMLIMLYLIGWVPMLYLGTRLSDRMWRKEAQRRVQRAYAHGWDAGYGFLQRIQDVRTDRTGSVKVRSSRAPQ